MPSRSRSEKNTVVIIGAGIAGLAAAHLLRERGVRSIVLEARNRIGGRIWTSRADGFHAELGAALIHRKNGNPIARLAREAGVKTVRSDFKNAISFDASGNRLDPRAVARAYSKFDRFLRAAKSKSRALKADISIAEGLKRVCAGATNADEKALLRRAQTDKILDTAEEFSRLSLLAWDEDEEFSGTDAVVIGGYDQILQPMLRGLDIRMSESVRHIRYDDANATVETARRTFRARAVLVTIPLGVLKTDAITFTPRLPDFKKHAIARMGFGELNKIVLRFPRRFWPAASEYFSWVDPTNSLCPEFLNQYAYDKSPILVGLWGGDAARRVLRRTDSEIQRAVLEQLSRGFGFQVPAPTSTQITRWGNDAFARGAYSYVPVGVDCAEMDALAEPLNDRLFFAGEATNREYPNTVHGAWLSGIREAERISRVL